MIKALGDIDKKYQPIIEKQFQDFGLEIDFVGLEVFFENFLESSLKDDFQGDSPAKLISFDKKCTKALSEKGIPFYNWDLLFSVLGPNDSEGEVEKKLRQRIEILTAILGIRPAVESQEIHGSIRVQNLAASSAFYCWLFGVEPKEWTHHYVTFVRPDTKFNFVLLVADGKELHHDTLYHLGIGVATKDHVVSFYHSALANGFHVEKPPRTTWRGTPLHELWLKDPDGTLIEIYARLTAAELEQMPADKEPLLLV